MADAPNAATAQRWCDMAAVGSFHAAVLRFELQVQFILPRRGDRQFVCPLPRGLPRARRRQRERQKLQDIDEKLFNEANPEHPAHPKP